MDEIKPRLSMLIALLALIVSIIAIVPDAYASYFAGLSANAERVQAEIASQKANITYEFDIFRHVENEHSAQIEKDLLIEAFDILKRFDLDNEADYANVRNEFPISRTLEGPDTSILFVFKNEGTAVAKNIRVSMDLGNEIQNVNLDYHEDASISQGGVGDTKVIVNVDRLTIGDTFNIEVTISSENFVGWRGNIMEASLNLPGSNFEGFTDSEPEQAVYSGPGYSLEKHNPIPEDNGLRYATHYMHTSDMKYSSSDLRRWKVAPPQTVAPNINVYTPLRIHTYFHYLDNIDIKVTNE